MKIEDKINQIVEDKLNKIMQGAKFNQFLKKWDAIVTSVIDENTAYCVLAGYEKDIPMPYPNKTGRPLTVGERVIVISELNSFTNSFIAFSINAGGTPPVSLPIASSSILGGIKVGESLKIDSNSGVLNYKANSTPEQVDSAVSRAIVGGEIDVALSNKVKINGNVTHGLDLNTLILDGHYALYSGNTNVPSENPCDWGHLIVVCGLARGGECLQILNATNGDVFSRKMQIADGVNYWSDWIKFSTSKDLDNKVSKQQIISNVSLNTIVDVGFYRLQGGITDYPATAIATQFGQLLVMYGGGDTVCQIYSDYDGHKLFYRTATSSYNNPVWSAWEEIATVKDLQNKNLLYNWDFRNPINQRGKTVYSFSSPNYGIDRWKALLGGSIFSIDNTQNCITLSGISSGFVQPLEMKFLENTNVTISAIYKGTIALTFYGTAFLNKVETSEQWSIAKYTYTIPAGTDLRNYLYAPIFGNGTAQEGSPSTKPLHVRAVKLEIGTVSTLKNDANADYGMELIKCQRYYQKFSFIHFPIGQISNNSIIPGFLFPVRMRINPAVKIFDQSGNENMVGTWGTPNFGIVKVVPAINSGIEYIGLEEIKNWVQGVAVFGYEATAEL